jgi:nitric oxide reductase
MLIEFRLRLCCARILSYHILGIPHRDQDYLNQCNAVRTSASATSGEAASANKDLVAYLHRLVESKAASEPTNDFISTLVHKHVRAGELDMQDAAQVTFLMLVAGNATVVGMLNLGVVELLQRPAQLAALKAEPRLWPSAVEELLRFHTASALATRRVALQDVRVGGTLIQAGDPVIASNQSANRDPTVFADPDEFDIFRAPNPHLAFGFGAHLCVAEWLCRAELIPAFEALFKEVPNLKLAVKPDEISWSPLGGDVGIAALPVRTQ